MPENNNSRGNILSANDTLDINELASLNDDITPEFIEQLQKAGMVFSGESPDGMLKETMELPELDWFVGCQFHPEFKSRPNKPHPLFAGFIHQ